MLNYVSLSLPRTSKVFLFLLGSSFPYLSPSILKVMVKVFFNHIWKTINFFLCVFKSVKFCNFVFCTCMEDLSVSGGSLARLYLYGKSFSSISYSVFEDF